MLDPREARAVAADFGVPLLQVRRDHLISHLLGALSAQLADRLLFFGGTSLARTLLLDGRLSEDIDLLALEPRSEVVDLVERVLAVGARQTHGTLTWDPPLTKVRDTQAGILHSADGDSLKVQLIDPQGYEIWPYSSQDLHQRYTDAPPARLNVPTPAAFVGWKTAAWIDRAAARDLYDLWGLALGGHFGVEAVRLFVKHGPFGSPPVSWMFAKAPAPQQWQRELAGQVTAKVAPDEALDVVAAAWHDAVREWSAQGSGGG